MTCYVSGCASLTGYPVDPINSGADLAVLRGFNGPEQVALYFQTDPSQRQALRDQIVYARLAAYDIEFQNFQADLNREANLGNLAGDFAVLTLTGLGATTGGAATKAALAAAATGVTGARLAINKDIFFNQALPAVLAQMSASRNETRAEIERGLALGIVQYPLPAALLDVNKYREAGSIPIALNILTATANVNKAMAQADEQAARVRRRALEGPTPVAGDTRIFRNMLIP
ncbi:MAG: hypothetical protein L0Y50_10225 [Beijerinckiaceae bacterium]|nr:hypothetical protein [Beijerinckiaceae bacterium]